MATAARWYKARMSYRVNACVEVFHQPGGATLVRDSMDPDGPRLRFTFQEWRDLLAALKGDGLTVDHAMIVNHVKAGLTFVGDRTDPSGPVLVFSFREWDHFVDGVVRGDFDRDYLTPPTEADACCESLLPMSA